MIYRYFWWAQQPLGDKGDPSTCQQNTDCSTTAWKADSPHPTHRQTITIQAVQALPGLLLSCCKNLSPHPSAFEYVQFNLHSKGCTLSFRFPRFLWSQVWTTPALCLPGDEGTDVRRAGTSTSQTGRAGISQPA